MNIFILDKNPKIAAEQHCDKHVVKMIVETAQLLSVAHHVAGSDVDHSLLYRKTHVNHPSSKWVRENSANYLWTFRLFSELLDEYTFRYGKTHSTSRLLPVLKTVPDINFSPTLTEFAQAMPEEYKIPGDAVQAYRDYYNGEKAYFAKWTKRPIPNWFKHLT